MTLHYMQLLLTGILLMTFLMVISKRTSALIDAFRIQSVFLFLTTLYLAATNNDINIYIVAFL